MILIRKFKYYKYLELRKAEDISNRDQNVLFN